VVVVGFIVLLDELNKRKVNRQRRMKLEMRHASRIRCHENRQMGFGEYLLLTAYRSFTGSMQMA